MTGQWQGGGSFDSDLCRDKYTDQTLCFGREGQEREGKRPFESPAAFPARRIFHQHLCFVALLGENPLPQPKGLRVQRLPGEGEVGEREEAAIQQGKTGGRRKEFKGRRKDLAGLSGAGAGRC